VTGRPDKLLPCEPLERVLTGCDPEAPEDELPCEPLARVLTGCDEDAPDDVLPCEPLARVVAVAPELATYVAPEWAPLARVATASAEPEALLCDPLAPVRALPLRASRTDVRLRSRGRTATDSWRTMWIVRRMIWVRTSTPRSRAAKVAVTVPGEGRSAKAASAPAAKAATPAAARVCDLPMSVLASRWLDAISLGRTH
jgi:hypothetical protein